METKISELDGKLVATLNGQLDTAAAVQVEKELKPLYDNEDKDIVIDCENLEYIASSGLRIMLGILKKAKQHGHTVTLTGLNDDIKNVFKMTGFINLFNFE
ncbi:MAG: STAS domain-containing protein [Muribaculaceae bacterium]|nr:STAS domain-containing protein [Muribaculaceae bacterium]MBQ2562727.1 STAS domain-containing protein [Muribaculaceae bacterium]MBQ5508381.1 STAS domain-containing protein [Muribaculaceae bacterium]MDY6292903.1 STAS domain-containing protein [Bacteroidales bacterium]